ncbi:hypothetical protein BY996DRAFT_6607724 [Phakopsora pachyrhizi]|nr:hypothetical protein BY996DRAFT_6607724 [Phakopsora pachyrhizi]
MGLRQDFGGAGQGRLGPGQVGQVGKAGAWLGFAGLGPGQVTALGLGSALLAGSWAGRAGKGRPGLGLALLGWGRQGQAGAWFGFAGLGPGQAKAGRGLAWFGFAGLGPGQARAGQQPGQGSPYLTDDLTASPSFQTRGKKEEEQDQKSKFGVERTTVRSLYQSPVVKASLSEYAASSSKEDISRLENLRKEHEKASKLKEEAAEKLKVLRSLKKEAEDDLFDLVSRKTSMSRRKSVVGSPLPTRVPSISAGSTTDKRKISPKTYETVTQGSSIKPRTEHEELMRYIPQPLQRLVAKIDNPPKDGDCRYTEEILKFYCKEIKIEPEHRSEL